MGALVDTDLFPGGLDLFDSGLAVDANFGGWTRRRDQTVRVGIGWSNTIYRQPADTSAVRGEAASPSSRR